MIFNASWREEVRTFILPRLAAAHVDLTRIAAALRDPNVDVWTESPSDTDRLTAGRQHYSLEGWRAHFKREFARMQAFEASHGAALQGYDPQARTALQGYLASMPAIGAAFNAVTAGYTSGGNLTQRLVTQTHRNQLAGAIEAELQ